jgi:chromosome segregation ATPase
MQRSITLELAEQTAINRDLEVRLTQSDLAFKEGTTKMNDLTTQVQELTAQAALDKAALQAAQERTNTDAAQIVQLTAKIADLEAAAKTVEQVAGDILGQVGAPPVEGATEPAKLTKDELWAQYRALPITKQREFYLANEKEMSA